MGIAGRASCNRNRNYKVGPVLTLVRRGDSCGRLPGPLLAGDISLRRLSRGQRRRLPLRGSDVCDVTTLHGYDDVLRSDVCTLRSQDGYDVSAAATCSSPAHRAFLAQFCSIFILCACRPMCRSTRVWFCGARLCFRASSRSRAPGSRT